MLPLSDLINDLDILPGRIEQSIEKEGVAKMFRSNNWEGRRVKVKPVVHEHWN